MPDLATELLHLEQADKHIAHARLLLAQAERRSPSGTGAGVSTSEDSLKTMRDTLAAFEAHREVIVQTIADIHAGKNRG